MQKVIDSLPKIELNNNNSKTPIVFVHGFNSSYQVHENFYKNSQKYDYYSLSLPGNNLLPATKEQLNVPYYAKLIAAYIKSKNLTNVVLIGHSMGGGIISFVWDLIPELISKMIYVAPMNKTSLKLEAVFFEDYFPKDIDGLKRFIRNLYFEPKFLEDPITVAKLEKEFNYDLYHNDNIVALGKSLPQMSLMNQIETHLQSIKVPTLLILGEDDGIIKRDECKTYFQQHVQNIQVVVVPKTGHMITNEATNEYIKIIETFIG